MNISTDAVLNLCLVSLFFHPVYAGPAVRFYHYALGLRKRNVQMRVFTGTGESKDRKIMTSTGAMLPPEVINDIPVQRIQLPAGKLYPKVKVMSAGLIKYLKESDCRPHILQFLTMPSYANLVQIKRFGIPAIYTQTMASDLSGNPVHRLIQIFNRRLPLNMMDCVVVSSSIMRDYLLSIGPKTHVEVIPNGVNLERFSPMVSLTEKQSLRMQLGLSPTAPIVVFVGSITPRKGVDILAKAWNQVGSIHRDAQLVLVGADLAESMQGGEHPEFLNALRSIINGSEAGKRIIFTGLVKNVEDYLRVSDLFVFPSSREGMPNAVLEAYACGLPSILVPFIGLPAEFGRPDSEYLLVDRTPESLADGIDKLLSSLQYRQMLGRRARAWAENHLGSEKSLDRYVELYRQLSQQSRKKRRLFVL